MSLVSYSKGAYSTQYEDGFQPGDLITAYTAGYHYFVSYTPRQGNVPLIHYKTAFDSKGRPRRSKTSLNCDASYCRPASLAASKAIAEKQNEVVLLTNMLANTNQDRK